MTELPIDTPNRIPWPPILLVAVIGAAVILGRLAPVPWPGTDDLGARVVGSSFAIAGAGLIVWALATFWRAGANVRPDRAASTLLTGGPFAVWRNPIYMGEVLALLGAAEVTRNIWFVAAAGVFALAVLKLAIVPEEAHLEARFGNDYLRYRARSRRWF